MNLNALLETLLKTDKTLCSSEGELLKQKVISHAQRFDSSLIALLLSELTIKNHFFKEIGGATVFDSYKFIDFMTEKNFLADSYTKYSNKVGLTISNKHIRQIDSVMLTFPFKDCILEGGQSKDDEKKKEIFFNETLAPDEVTRLLAPKVITNIKRYSVGNSELDTKSKSTFTRDENGTIKDNLIIKGNNLLALHTLKSNFANRVKLIYIDPPYNTGNDSFGYNDRFNHSTWLTFMKNRLEVARELLRDDGVIFVSIDDNEQAYLKVLMDEIFGRENFVANFVWNKKNVVQNDAKFTSVNHEHILSYRKSILLKDFNLLVRTDEMNARYANPDNDPLGEWTSVALQAKSGSESNTYEMTFSNGVSWKPVDGTYPRLNQESLLKAYNDGRLWFGKDGKNVPRLKKYLTEVKQGAISNSIWLNSDVGSTQLAKETVKKLLEKNIFSTPKPEELIKRIIELSTKPNDIVLDFHLGSGTTTAVAHKMGRQYIGIEQMDYIETISVERMKKVIDGEQGGISKAVDWNGGGSFVYMELDRYNQKFIDDLSVSDEQSIMSVYDEVLKGGFLNYDVEVEKIEANRDEFEALALADKKEFLVSILNKNVLYKNLSEIEDEDLGVSEHDKAINREFYGADNE